MYLQPIGQIRNNIFICVHKIFFICFEVKICIKGRKAKYNTTKGIFSIRFIPRANELTTTPSQSACQNQWDRFHQRQNKSKTYILVPPCLSLFYFKSYKRLAKLRIPNSKLHKPKTQIINQSCEIQFIALISSCLRVMKRSVSITIHVKKLIQMQR